MKILITAKNKDALKSEMDSRFGRANYFAIINKMTLEVNIIGNTAAEVASGAGVKAAQLATDQKVDIVISGNFGPKAFAALQSAKIKMFLSTEEKIKKALEAYLNGDLEELGSPSNNGYYG